MSVCMSMKTLWHDFHNELSLCNYKFFKGFKCEGTDINSNSSR
jgi:hypothetical protein